MPSPDLYMPGKPHFRRETCSLSRLLPNPHLEPEGDLYI